MSVVALCRSKPLCSGLFVSIASAAAFVGVFRFLKEGTDILRAYPSPERHDSGREIEVTNIDALRVAVAEVAEADFDGDRTPDHLRVEYFHVEPLFRRSTSGMLYVRSGRTREVLLAHAVETPMNRCEWCGDVDGNGTDDVLIDDDGRQFVLGFVGER